MVGNHWGRSGEVIVKVALVAQETIVAMSESSSAYHIHMRINLDVLRSCALLLSFQR